MKKTLLLILMCIFSLSISSQSIFGKWKSIDGQTGKEKAIVEIYKENLM